MRWSWLLLILGMTAPAWAGELPPVKIGLVVPMAGEAGRVGQSMRQAAEMAVADWMETLGRKTELALGDDQFDPKQAVVAAERLVQDGVWGVVGHFYSSSSIPASAVYSQAGIPQITPTSTHPRLTEQGFDSVFRVSGRDDQHAISAADFIQSRLKARRIAVIHDRTEYGRTLAETLIRMLEQRSAKRIVAIEAVAQGDKDFSVVIARLKAVEPDVVYFGGIFREGGYLIRQMRQAGLQAAFVSGDAVLDPEFVKIAGEEAASGAYLTFAPDPRLLPSARPFIRRFEERYGPIGPYVLYTYDAVGALLWAIHHAKPLTNTKEELRKVLKVMHGNPYDGTLGRIRWDKRGDLATSPYVVYVTRKGGSLHGWF
ncbi:MAG TPA: branched-chain amino acid ABC transporter substrate-binding protein, partial [Candidatus Methylomirabilis sp.]|nr:branched-chain amino acid ABC transporter substrate-binding protein [Candidatus Methylomirabilis sp.]